MFKTITKHSAAELDAPMKYLGQDGLNSLRPLSTSFFLLLTLFLRSVSKLHIVVVVVVAIVVAVVVVVIVAVVIVVVFNIITRLFPIV